MPSVTEVIYIKAEPAKVFDLVAKVEDFTEYSSLVKEIKCIAPKTYRWTVNIYGVELEWDAKVVEMAKPKKFAWQSINGVQNSGFYILEPAAGGTQVTFFMEYHLSAIIMEKLAQIFTGGFMKKMASEILSNVKKKLEL